MTYSQPNQRFSVLLFTSYAGREARGGVLLKSDPCRTESADILRLTSDQRLVGQEWVQRLERRRVQQESGQSFAKQPVEGSQDQQIFFWVHDFGRALFYRIYESVRSAILMSS